MNNKNNIAPLYLTDYSVIQQFAESMRSRAITPPENIQISGSLERFHIQGDKSNSLMVGMFCTQALYLAAHLEAGKPESLTNGAQDLVSKWIGKSG